MWWLSFADPYLPEGSQNLGIALVDAGESGFGVAVMMAHALGINPGGEVRGIEIPATASIPEGSTNRLLSKAEAEAIFGRLVLMPEPEE